MKKRALRPRSLLTLAIGLVIGIIIAAPPVGAHVGGTVQHLWRDHIRPKADARYVNDSIGSVSSDVLAGNEIFGDGIGNDNSTCEGNEVCQLSAACPAGDLVVNGGYRLVSPGTTVLESYAGVAEEWDVTVLQDASVDTFLVNAHCINR